MKGTLHIFLGYAPGVGKSEALLSAAHQARSHGQDVVVGVLRPVDRQSALDLETVNSTSDDSAEVEFDLDAALSRRPQAIIIDDLAHQNGESSRHEQRYQDVQELLEAGIDVYTAVNAYHFESLSDQVEAITGIDVEETVPDTVLESADQLRLVDLAPGELLRRYQTGEAHPPWESLKDEGNLIALREITLRLAANRIEDDVRRFRQSHSVDKLWPTNDRLLVCVGPSPLSQPLVRATKRLADSIKAPWIALHVAHQDISPSQRENVQRNLELARALGAQVREVTAPFTSSTIAQFAQDENITKLVIGKPNRRAWQGWKSPSLVDQLLSHSTDLDVIVVGTHGESEEGIRPPASTRSAPPGGYASAAGGVLIATVLSHGLPAEFDRTNIVMLYLAAVVCISYLLGRGPAILASVLSVSCFNFFFVPPTFTFDVAHPQYLVTFLGFFLVSWLVSDLTERNRETAAAALRREKQAVTLFALQRDLLQTTELERLSAVAENHLKALFGPHLLLLGKDDGLNPVDLGDKEKRVAEWAFQNNHQAGKSTKTFPDAAHSWYPVAGPSKVYGVVGLEEPSEDQEAFELFQAVLHQIGAAFERRELAKSAAERDLLRATESLQKALLNSVSHDLRIPLVSINGALSSLLNTELKLSDTARQEMTENALSEAERLTQLVTNLLHMSKMEAGQMQIHALACDLWDLVSTTVSSFRKRPDSPRVELEGDDDIPFVRADYVLVQQVLFNLLENALRYGEGTVTIKLESNAEEAIVSVTDQGQPIPEEEAEHLFDRFYRSRDLADGGSGLGLSICKGLVEAHGGRIWIEGGKTFRFSLPLEG